MLAWLTSWVRVVPCIPQKGHHARAGVARPTQTNRAISGRRILVRRPVIGGSPCASEAAWGRAVGEGQCPVGTLPYYVPTKGIRASRSPRKSWRKPCCRITPYNGANPSPPPPPLRGGGGGEGFRPRSIGVGVLGTVDDLDKLVGRVVLVGRDDQGADVLVPGVRLREEVNPPLDAYPLLMPFPHVELVSRPARINQDCRVDRKGVGRTAVHPVANDVELLEIRASDEHPFERGQLPFVALPPHWIEGGPLQFAKPKAFQHLVLWQHGDRQERGGGHRRGEQSDCG